MHDRLDPVQIVAVTIDHLVEAVTVIGFIAMLAVITALASGQVPV